MYVYELCIAVPVRNRFRKNKREFGSQTFSLSNRRYVVDSFLGEGGFNRACLLMRGDSFGGRSFDQGTVGAVLSKKRIREFLDLFYRQPVYHKRARKMIEPLDDEQEYYLLLTECIEV